MPGTKRKSTDGGEPASPIDLDSIEIPEGTPLDSCTVVRGKINRFIESGEMKIGDFCDTLGVSQNAYRRFLALNGKDKGAGCDTYIAAWEFFKKREMAGIKPPKKQKMNVPAAAAKKDAAVDLSDIHLEGMPRMLLLLLLPFFLYFSHCDPIVEV